MLTLFDDIFKCVNWKRKIRHEEPPRGADVLFTLMESPETGPGTVRKFARLKEEGKNYRLALYYYRRLHYKFLTVVKEKKKNDSKE